MGNTFPRPSACFGKDPEKAEKITPVNPSPVELYTEVEQGQGKYFALSGNRATSWPNFEVQSG